MPEITMTSPGPFSLSPNGYVIRDANLHAVAILAARNETTADGKLLTAAPRMREALKKIEAEVSGMVHAFPHWEEHLAEIRGALLAAGGVRCEQAKNILSPAEQAYVAGMRAMARIISAGWDYHRKVESATQIDGEFQAQIDEIVAQGLLSE